MTWEDGLVGSVLLPPFGQARLWWDFLVSSEFVSLLIPTPASKKRRQTGSSRKKSPNPHITSFLRVGWSSTACTGSAPTKCYSRGTTALIWLLLHILTDYV